MEQLKEHRAFRNQCIGVTIMLLSIGFIFSIYELIAFGIIMGFIALYNVFSYNENKKDFNKLDISKRK